MSRLAKEYDDNELFSTGERREEALTERKMKLLTLRRRYAKAWLYILDYS